MQKNFSENKLSPKHSTFGWMPWAGMGRADIQSKRSWGKKKWGEPWGLKHNVDFQENKTSESGRVLIVPHKSGVRSSPNMIFKSLRPNQTCKHNAHGEMWNSGRRGWSVYDFKSVFVEHGRELQVSAACSSTWSHTVLRRLKVWERSFFKHRSMSPSVFTKEFQFACFSVKGTL